MSLSWLRAEGDDAVITLHVQPGAKKTEVAGLHGEALKIRLAAPPVDGKANDCLVAFLAKRLGVPKSRVALIAGDSSRSKRVRVGGVTTAAVESALVQSGVEKAG
jgi:uncharacterized protein (TIGR00251 family)